MLILRSKGGDLSALFRKMLERSRQEQSVSMVIESKVAAKKHYFERLLMQYGSIEEALGAGDVEGIVYDMTGLGKEADKYRKWLPVWGGGELQDALEEDRGFGLWVMASLGVRIPTSVIFGAKSLDSGGRKMVEEGVTYLDGHLDQAIDFVRADGGRWVLKPCGGSAPTSLTYVSKSAEDMVARLEKARDHHEIKPGVPFLLQRFVEGIELSTEVWVVNGVPIMPLNATMETKRFLPGDYGPNTGCQTSVVWNYPEGSIPRVAAETFWNPQFLAWLKAPVDQTGKRFLPLHGPLDLNTIIPKDGGKPFGLEWTPRHGYSAIYALCELMSEDYRKLWTRLAGGDASPIGMREGFGYATRVSIPPYPMAEELDDKKYPRAQEAIMEQATGVEIKGPIDSEHVWLLDAKWDEEMGLVTAGVDGVVCEVTSRGDTIEEARDAAHAIFEKLEINNKMARIVDGADRAIKDFRSLRQLGYVR